VKIKQLRVFITYIEAFSEITLIHFARYTIIAIFFGTSIIIISQHPKSVVSFKRKIFAPITVLLRVIIAKGAFGFGATE
jgi:hypothetical protein